MSAKVATMARMNKELLKQQGVKLDKLEKVVTLLVKSLSALEKGARTPSSGKAVPQAVARPETLVDLELGRDPRGA